MANRAYLYAKKGKTIKGISEIKYEIPIVYKILVSQNTKRVKSKIFKSPVKLALQGDFKKGKKKLYTFLEELKEKEYFERNELKELTDNAIAFLEQLGDYDYFHLEGAEIYEFSPFPPFLSNIRIHKRISHIDKEIENFYQQINELKKEYDAILKKISEKENNPKAAKELQTIKDTMMSYFGIREWSEYLYYEI